MANTGRPNSNGSQFFIVFDDLTALGRLSPDYSLFGQMVEGEATLAKIEAVPVGVAGTGERSRPQETITITSIEIAKARSAALASVAARSLGCRPYPRESPRRSPWSMTSEARYSHWNRRLPTQRRD